MKLDKVEAAESGGVLVLLAALDPKVLPFDLVGQIGDLVVGEGQV